MQSESESESDNEGGAILWFGVNWWVREGTPVASYNATAQFVALENED